MTCKQCIVLICRHVHDLFYLFLVHKTGVVLHLTEKSEQKLHVFQASFTTHTFKTPILTGISVAPSSDNLCDHHVIATFMSDYRQGLDW
jgi:hypothetical protein